jgi:exonuclease V gamma subunit
LAFEAPFSSAHQKRNFFPTAETHVHERSVLTVHSLRTLAKSPIQFYFNTVLGIYIKRDEEPQEDSFRLSALHRAKLKRACLQSSFEKVISISKAQGMLPEGMFKEVAIDALSSEVQDYAVAFKELSISGDEIFSVEFSPYCRKAQRSEKGNWILPALTFYQEGKEKIQVIGTLFDVTPQGYLVHGKQDVETLLAAWPLYLIFLHVRKSLGDLPARILFAKSGELLDCPELNADMLLQEYIDYALRARDSLSPLMPKWASALLLKTPVEFEKCVHNAMEKEQLFYTDPYLEWMTSAQISFDAYAIYDEWAPYLRTRFAPVLTILGGDA